MAGSKRPQDSGGDADAEDKPQSSHKFPLRRVAASRPRNPADIAFQKRDERLKRKADAQKAKREVKAKKAAETKAALIAQREEEELAKAQAEKLRLEQEIADKQRAEMLVVASAHAEFEQIQQDAAMQALTRVNAAGYAGQSDPTAMNAESDANQQPLILREIHDIGQYKYVVDFAGMLTLPLDNEQRLFDGLKPLFEACNAKNAIVVPNADTSADAAEVIAAAQKHAKDSYGVNDAGGLVIVMAERSIEWLNSIRGKIAQHSRAVMMQMNRATLDMKVMGMKKGELETIRRRAPDDTHADMALAEIARDEERMKMYHLGRMNASMALSHLNAALVRLQSGLDAHQAKAAKLAKKRARQDEQERNAAAAASSSFSPGDRTEGT